ncbi:hypothetical protein [Clostridium beijerinckii]|uniref:hypothetical protein n=1 Tax=Clostridium beijerinckii TaxID=1520 RepID=UPI0022E6A07F|nr:hypothetical protein [Clostridium beijerinckii]
MEDKVKKKKGRNANAEITNNDMLVWIERYLREYPNEEIKIKKLSEFASIPRHYWYDRESIRDKIKEINNIKYEEYDIAVSSKSNKYLLELPDIESLVENNYRSKTKLKQVIGRYFDTIQEFYMSACEKFELDKEHKRAIKKIQTLEKELEKIRIKYEHYKGLAESYEKQIRTIVIRSSESTFREENNIKQNLIKLDKTKRVALSTKSEELESLLEKL